MDDDTSERKLDELLRILRTDGSKKVESLIKDGGCSLCDILKRILKMDEVDLTNDNVNYSSLKVICGLTLKSGQGGIGRGSGVIASIIASKEPGCLVQVKLLLEAGVDPNAGLDRYVSWDRLQKYPLWQARQTQDEAMTRLLLDHGADPFRGTDLWGSPLAAAVARVDLEEENFDKVELVNAIYDSEMTRETLPREMYVAVSMGIPRIIAMLCGDVNMVIESYLRMGGFFRGTLLEVAISCNQPNACKWLLDNGADPYLAVANTGITPLKRACHGDGRAVRTLLEYGCELEIEPGRSIFDYALKGNLWRGVLSITRYLLCEPGKGLKAIYPKGNPLLKILDVWTQGHDYTYKDFSALAECASLLIWAGAGKASRNKLILLLKRMCVYIEIYVNERKSRVKNMTPPSFDGLFLLVEAVIMTRNISWRNVLRLYSRIRDFEEKGLGCTQELLKEYLETGLSLKQSCRLAIRKSICPPLQLNILSDEIPLPVILKSYITGGRITKERYE